MYRPEDVSLLERCPRVMYRVGTWRYYKSLSPNLHRTEH